MSACRNCSIRDSQFGKFCMKCARQNWFVREILSWFALVLVIGLVYMFVGSFWHPKMLVVDFIIGPSGAALAGLFVLGVLFGFLSFPLGSGKTLEQELSAKNVLAKKMSLVGAFAGALCAFVFYVIPDGAIASDLTFFLIISLVGFSIIFLYDMIARRISKDAVVVEALIFTVAYHSVGLWVMYLLHYLR